MDPVVAIAVVTPPPPPTPLVAPPRTPLTTPMIPSSSSGHKIKKISSWSINTPDASVLASRSEITPPSLSISFSRSEPDLREGVWWWSPEGGWQLDTPRVGPIQMAKGFIYKSPNFKNC